MTPHYSKGKCIELKLQMSQNDDSALAFISQSSFWGWTCLSLYCLITPLYNHSLSLSLLNHRLRTLPCILATAVSGLCNCIMNHGRVCGWEVCVCVCVCAHVCIHVSARFKLVLWVPLFHILSIINLWLNNFF